MKLLLKALIIITLTVLFIGWWVDAGASLPGKMVYCPMCEQPMPIDHMNVRVGMGIMKKVRDYYMITPLGEWLRENSTGVGPYYTVYLQDIPDSLRVYFPRHYFNNPHIQAQWNERMDKTCYLELWHKN